MPSESTSPLRPWHEQAQAEFQDYYDTPIVSTYGRLPLEYAAMYRSAGVFDMAHRGVLAVTGEERHAFLNNVLTAEIVQRDSGQALAEGESRFSFLLQRTGRIVGEMNIFETGDKCLLEMDRRLLPEIAKELEKYHFREKVKVEAEESLHVVGVIGPGAAKLVSDKLGMPATELPDGRGMVAADGRSVWRMDIGQLPMLLLLLPEPATLASWAQLLSDEKSAVATGWAAFNAVRIESSRGIFGIDYDSTFLPAETGQLQRAVSFTKGCYPGQEIVARMHARDQYARKLVQLRFEDDGLPLAGTKVYDAAGSEVGAVTSSTISPRQSGVAMALAGLKREAIESGGPLRIPAEGSLRAAVIT